MKFKCVHSGCVYSFDQPNDIEAMKRSLDYVVVLDAPKPIVIPLKAPVVPATIAVAIPKPSGPDKPLPAPAVVPKAV